MKKKKPRTVAASDHEHADDAALTLLFGNEHLVLHLSLFVVLPLPYLCKACAQQGGSSFTSAHVYALSCHENHRKWTSCRFSESRVFMMEIVKRQPVALRLASDALKDDREIVLEAVKQYGDCLKYASVALQDDREIVLEAVKHNGYCLLYTSPSPRDTNPSRMPSSA